MNNVNFKKAVQNYYIFFNRPNFFPNFAPKSVFTAMKKLKKILGLPLVCAGVAILAASYFIPYGSTNALLLTGLFLVVAGTATYVWKKKR